MVLCSVARSVDLCQGNVSGGDGCSSIYHQTGVNLDRLIIGLGREESHLSQEITRPKEETQGRNR